MYSRLLGRDMFKLKYGDSLTKNSTKLQSESSLDYKDGLHRVKTNLYKEEPKLSDKKYIRFVSDGVEYTPKQIG